MKHIALLSISLFVNIVISSEQNKCIITDKKTIADFFPIENSYKNILIINEKDEPFTDAYLTSNAQQLLESTQHIFSGLCYAGILHCVETNSTLSIITFQHPYYLTLQIHAYVNNTCNTKSVNIDPTFKQSLTKKYSFEQTLTKKYFLEEL